MARKWEAVREIKNEVIKKEILKIGEKDTEARKLERQEKQILERLRKTHIKQEEAIKEIQIIF